VLCPLLVLLVLCPLLLLWMGAKVEGRGLTNRVP
jgi:hypothetical protein